jgi:predicted transposase YbfD/YdcC
VLRAGGLGAAGGTGGLPADFPARLAPGCRGSARQAIKITRRRQDTATGRTSRETVHAVTTLTSAHATAPDLARLVREHWSVEAHHHHIRDTTFSEDTAASRTGSGPANLATIRAAVIAAIKDAGYLHVPEGRRDHITPAETLRLHGLDIGQKWDIHGTRGSPAGCRRRRPTVNADLQTWKACWGVAVCHADHSRAGGQPLAQAGVVADFVLVGRHGDDQR